MIEDFAWVTIVARALERLLIVGVGFAALFYGFGLFKIVTEQNGQLIAEKGDVKVHLSQVGPGVFFALFGAAVITALIYKGPELNDVTGRHSTTFRGGVATNFPAEAETLRKTLASLNSLQALTAKATLSDPDKQIFSESTDGIDVIRSSLIDTYLGETGRFAEWQMTKNTQQNALKQFEEQMKDPNAKSRFQEVEKLVNITLNTLRLEGQE